jgi:hypothetical protein
LLYDKNRSLHYASLRSASVGMTLVYRHFFVMPHSTVRPVLGTMPSILSAR